VELGADDVAVEGFEGCHQVVANLFAFGVGVGGDDDFVKLDGNPLQRLKEGALVPFGRFAAGASVFRRLLAAVGARFDGRIDGNELTVLLQDTVNAFSLHQIGDVP
jgi:hypothetical protein